MVENAEDSMQQLGESIFDLGGEAHAHCVEENKVKCPAHKIAIELLGIYHDNERFSERLRKHVVEEDALKIENLLKTYEKDKGVKIDEMVNWQYPGGTKDYSQLYKEIKNKLWKSLETDRKDEFGMRNADWKKIKYLDEIPVGDPLTSALDYVIGQEDMVEKARMIARAGANRHLSMWGPPGTGKSLTAKGMKQETDKANPIPEIPYNPNRANKLLFLSLKDKYGRTITGHKVNDYYDEKILPKKLEKMPRGMGDILSIWNPEQPTLVPIRMLPPGWGPKHVEYLEATEGFWDSGKEGMMVASIITYSGAFAYYMLDMAMMGQPLIGGLQILGGAVQAAFLYVWYKMFSGGGMGMMGGGSSKSLKLKRKLPGVLVDNVNKVPYIDATGANSEQLLGTTQHDPWGGMSMPEHQALRAGRFHMGNGGYMFWDEIESVLNPARPDYTDLVAGIKTLLEDGFYPIQARGSGIGHTMSNVRSYRIPARVNLVIGGNEIIKEPALRSRLFAEGYTSFVNTEVPDYPEYRRRMLSFVEQWKKLKVTEKGDNTYLRWTTEAGIEFLKLVKDKAGRRNSLTLFLRDMGGYVMYANGVALRDGADAVMPHHVQEAREKHQPPEFQEIEHNLEKMKDHSVTETDGALIGRVNGLSVITLPNGRVGPGNLLPLEASLTEKTGPDQKIYAGDNELLGKIARSAVNYTSTVFKKIIGKDIKKYDITLQYLQTYNGMEGDSASLATLIALISDYGKVPIRQDTAITGSLSVRGYILPVGGIDEKLRAAQRYGAKRAIIPKKNEGDVPTDTKLEMHYGNTISDYLNNVFVWDYGNRKHAELMKNIEKLQKELGKIEYKESQGKKGWWKNGKR